MKFNIIGSNFLEIDYAALSYLNVDLIAQLKKRGFKFSKIVDLRLDEQLDLILEGQKSLDIYITKQKKISFGPPRRRSQVIYETKKRKMTIPIIKVEEAPFTHNGIDPGHYFVFANDILFRYERTELFDWLNQGYRAVPDYGVAVLKVKDEIVPED